MFKMVEGSGGCSGETLLATCTRKKRLQRKMTKDYYWIGVQGNIGMFSKSWSDRNSLILLSLFERPARPMFIKMRRQEIVMRASEYLLTRCEWFLRREEIRLNLLFAVSKCDVTIQQRSSSRCSKWPNRMGSLQW